MPEQVIGDSLDKYLIDSNCMNGSWIFEECPKVYKRERIAVLKMINVLRDGGINNSIKLLNRGSFLEILINKPGWNVIEELNTELKKRLFSIEETNRKKSWRPIVVSSGEFKEPELDDVTFTVFGKSEM